MHLVVSWAKVGAIRYSIMTLIKHGVDSKQYSKHVDRLKDYLWMGVDGMKMNGTNGSQLWDTSFFALAMLESGSPPLK